MRAAVRRRYGTPDVVELVEIDRPTPVEDEILVRVEAASVNRADLDGLTPRPQFLRLFNGMRAPRNPRIGLDVAGVVEAVGPSEVRFQPGDRVFADLFSFGQGAFAEFVCAPQRAFQPIPASMSFEDAATLPHSAILAVQGLRLKNGRTIRPGDRVLIDGASGNVGPFAVQIAKALGAQVTATASPAKIAFMYSLGADHVLDYTTNDYTRTGKRYDWILDTDSHHPILRARRHLEPGGVYITLGGTSRPLLAALLLGTLASNLRPTRWSGLLLWWHPFKAEDVATITSLIAEGKVVPQIDRAFPLEHVAEALRYVDDGRARGKVLVVPK